MTFWHPAELGYAVRQKLADWGFGARLLGQLALLSGPFLKRFVPVPLPSPTPPTNLRLLHTLYTTSIYKISYT